MLSTQAINTAALAQGQGKTQASGADFAPFLSQAMGNGSMGLSRLAGLIMRLAREVRAETSGGAAPAAGEPGQTAGLPSGGQASFSQAELELIAERAAEKYGLAPELVKSVVAAESSWRVDAESHAGAQGLMQLMPGTARDMGVSDSFDPRQNIEGGTKYLSSLVKRYDGDVKKALAAYNWGPGNLAKGGRQPAETRNYVAKVTGLMQTQRV